eukprot:s24_g28.t1
MAQELSFQLESPRTDYHRSFDDSFHLQSRMMFWTKPLVASDIVRSLLPWLIALFLGVLTAITGSAIAIFSDFLGDARFGFCRGLLLADRNRCCGGSENVDYVLETCKKPAIGDDGVVWVPWAHFFEFSGTADAILSLFLYVSASLVFTGLAAYLVYEYAPTARGSGIPEVKAAVSGYDLPLSFTGACLVIKALGLSLVVGAGLSLGKEGPLIHIGVCLASTLQRACGALGLRRAGMPFHEMACIGAAAGVSTAFGAPLGGVLFAVEELGSVRSLSQRTLLLAFLAAFAASFTLKSLNLTGANRLTLFALSLPTHTARKEWISWEMFAFFLIGVTGGIGGGLFVMMNLWCTSQRRQALKEGRLWFLPMLPCKQRGTLNVLECVIIALVTATLSYPFTQLLRSLSTEAIHALFETCPNARPSHFGLCDPDDDAVANISLHANMWLLIAAVVRLFQTTYTFGAAIPSGLFIPSLYVGAALGRLIGNLIFRLAAAVSEFPVHIEPAVFAMVGAISMLSGFCRMTVSLVVIMFELTGELNYIVPFMCAVLTAKLVGDMMTASIYDAHASLNGYAPIEGQADIRFDTVLADITKPGVHTGSVKAGIEALGVPESCVAVLTPQAPLLTAYCAFQHKPELQFCVCTESRRLGKISVISRADFEAALGEHGFPLSRPTAEDYQVHRDFDTDATSSCSWPGMMRLWSRRSPSSARERTPGAVVGASAVTDPVELQRLEPWLRLPTARRCTRRCSAPDTTVEIFPGRERARDKEGHKETELCKRRASYKKSWTLALDVYLVQSIGLSIPLFWRAGRAEYSLALPRDSQLVALRVDLTPSSSEGAALLAAAPPLAVRVPSRGLRFLLSPGVTSAYVFARLNLWDSMGLAANMAWFAPRVSLYFASIRENAHGVRLAATPNDPDAELEWRMNGGKWDFLVSGLTSSPAEVATFGWTLLEVRVSSSSLPESLSPLVYQVVLARGARVCHPSCAYCSGPSATDCESCESASTPHALRQRSTSTQPPSAANPVIRVAWNVLMVPLGAASPARPRVTSDLVRRLPSSVLVTCPGTRRV